MTVTIKQATFTRKISASLDPLRDHAVWFNRELETWINALGPDYIELKAGVDNWSNLTSYSQNHGSVMRIYSDGDRSGADTTNSERYLWLSFSEYWQPYWYTRWSQSTSNNGLGTPSGDNDPLNYTSSRPFYSSYYSNPKQNIIIWDDNPDSAFFCWRHMADTGYNKLEGLFRMPNVDTTDCPEDVGNGWAWFNAYHRNTNPLTCIDHTAKHPWKGHSYSSNNLFPSSSYDVGQVYTNLPVTSGRLNYMGNLGNSVIYMPGTSLSPLTRLNLGGVEYTTMYSEWAVRTDG